MIFLGARKAEHYDRRLLGGSSLVNCYSHPYQESLGTC